MRKLLTIFRKVYSSEEWVWFLIWFTLPVSIRLNSLSILIGTLVILVSYIRNPHTISRRQLVHLSIPFMFFLLHALGVFNSLLNLQTWKELEQMLPFLVIPLLFILGKTGKNTFTQIALTALVLSLTISGVIMLVESTWRFIPDMDFSYYTYHNLIAPFHSGAIYFSLFLIAVLFQINELTWLSRNRWWKYIIVIFILILLFLAASKLMIGIGIPLFILKYRNQLIYTFLRRKIIIPIIILLGLIIVVPVGLRLNKLLKPNLEEVFAEQYKYDSPMNGLNLRLIQARFGMKILEENNAWLTGVGILDAQKLLNIKYIEYGLYTGYEGTDDTGYLNYNFHNQFVETFVRSGIIGIVLLFAMFLSLLMIPQSKLFISHWIILIVFMFFITESVLERQQGIVYFCLIYSSYFYKHPQFDNRIE
ncbi:MAG: hypothetical protein HQ521_20820 [Bacteroidetes bacterium]|nr:hypothetical protein [Bacteroidota bacterium]